MKVKVSEYQRSLLEQLNDYGEESSCSFNGKELKSLNILNEKGLVSAVNYSNGEHWRLTDSGRIFLEG